MPKEKKPPRVTIASLQAELVASKEETKRAWEAKDREKLATNRLITAAYDGANHMGFGVNPSLEVAIERIYNAHRTIKNLEVAENAVIRTLREENEKLWNHLRALSGLKVRTYHPDRMGGMEIMKEPLNSGLFTGIAQEDIRCGDQVEADPSDGRIRRRRN